jgi:NAD+ synthase
LEEEAEEEHQAAPVEVAERSDLDLRSQVKRTQTAQKLLKFPGLDTGKARKVLLQFLRDEMERRGAQKIVVGVSGGMNSAVSAGLAVEALGRDHVTLIHLVEQDKGSQARSHADLVARCLQSPLEIMDQRSHLNMLPRHHDALLPHQKNRLRRERAAALYEVCEAHPGQVLLGSLDKTQWLLGFGVEGGNLEYAFNPLGDLYHHQVRELARAMGVPREILDQDTKAELSNEIAADAKPGWTWEEMDYYLYQMVDAKIALSYLLFLGLDEEKLRWVYRRLRDTAHQRKMAPVADALSAYVQRSGLPRS